MTWGDAKHLDDRQALALHICAIIEEKPFAQLRRDIMTEAADRALADPAVADIVRLALRARREQLGTGLRVVGS